MMHKLRRVQSNKSIGIFILLLLILNACGNNTAIENAGYTEEVINIDGIASESAWQSATWKPINQKWLGPDYTVQDFSGKYKILWNQLHLFLLVEITDDVLMDQSDDGLVQYWDDDCLEIFVDEDASGGDHQYNYNAFAYHIGLDNRVVDIGEDSLPHYYDHITCVRNTEGNISLWELSMDIYGDDYRYDESNRKKVLNENKEIGFAIAYCDNDDSEQRENFIGSVEVLGDDKNRGWIDAGIFEKLLLTK